MIDFCSRSDRMSYKGEAGRLVPRVTEDDDWSKHLGRLAVWPWRPARQERQSFRKPTAR